MASKELINLGTSPDSGTGDTARKGGMKINNLFADVYSNYGDNPIGNDPDGKNYGYRQTFGSNEYKVGELHQATKFRRVTFDSDAELSFYRDEGYVLKDSDGTIYEVGETKIPAIYQSNEFYFASRGEQITPDFSKLPENTVAHIVLPLARAGDRVIIKDSLSHVSSTKQLSFWTTPYEWKSKAQADEWITNTPEANNPSVVSKDHTNIKPPTTAALSCSIRETSYVSELITAGYVNQTFAGVTNSFDANKPKSPITIEDAGKTIEFLYRGHDQGWAYSIKSITGNGDEFHKITDTFNDSEWFEWTESPLFDSDQIITTGQYILPIMTPLGSKIDSSSSGPVYEVFQTVKSKVINDDNDSDDFGNTIKYFFDEYITDNSGDVVGDGDDSLSSPSTEQKKYRRAQIAAGDSSFTNGFDQSIDRFYHKIDVPAVITDNGQLLLISNYKFSGRVDIMTDGGIL